MSGAAAYLHLASVLCFSAGAYRIRGRGVDRNCKRLVCAAILFQAMALYQATPQLGFRTFHFGAALAHFALFSVAAMVALDGRGGFSRSWKWLAALAGIASALNLLPIPEHRLPRMSGALVAHLLIATLAYCAFIVSLAQMTETFLAGRGLARHEKRADGEIALLDMERIVFRNVSVAFALLTLTIVSGAVLYLQDDPEAVRTYFTHKNLFAVMTWALCAVLLLGRWRRGWRGFVALRWYAASTACLLLSYLGTIFVIDVILGR